ncbi:MAG: DUF1080 domain-containing protein [Sedimentisphaerales bacterium]|nr:DUF1080 domain-containing protein [Sedimentisphaerales bacterium]
MNIKSALTDFDSFRNFLRLKKFMAYVLILVFFFGCASERQVDESVIDLFDGKSLGKWEESDFFEGGNICVKDGSIYIEKSKNRGYMQGIRWTGPLVSMNYEITLEAMSVEGSDFFCGLTFPVGERSCSLILGGWGGKLCGLSCLDYMDASENETTTFMDFEHNRWYRVCLRVTPDRIEAWLDEEPLVDVDTTDKFIDIRFECEPSLPLGIATYQTTSAIRNIKITKLEEQPIMDSYFEEY